MSVRQFQRDLYRAARVTADLRAASQGPTAYARRRGWRVVYRNTDTPARRICRVLGL